MKPHLERKHSKIFKVIQRKSFESPRDKISSQFMRRAEISLVRSLEIIPLRIQKRTLEMTQESLT